MCPPEGNYVGTSKRHPGERIQARIFQVRGEEGGEGEEGGGEGEAGGGGGEEVTPSAATTFLSLKESAGNTMLTEPGLIGALRVIDIVLESDKSRLKLAKDPGLLSENEFGGKLSAKLDV